MAIKIVKGAGDSVQIGNSDYPLNSFRAQYLGDQVKLIPVNTNLVKAGALKFKYTDLIDGDDAPIGATDAAVSAYLQANLYTQPAPGPEE